MWIAPINPFILVAAEEADGSWLRAGLGEGHDGGPEAAGPGSEPGRGRRGGLPLPADPGASTAAGGAAGPQQHAGEQLIDTSNLTYC